MFELGYQYNDGGRAAAGYKGKAGDCVARALAILTGHDYQEVYKTVGKFEQRYGRKRSARNGVSKKAIAKAYADAGLVKIKLPGGPRPTFAEAWDRYGDCIVSTTHHVAAVTAGALQDTDDCRTYEWDDGSGDVETRERKAMSIWIRG